MEGYKSIIVLCVVSTLSWKVDSYRQDFISGMPVAGAVRQQPAHMSQQQQQGCVWSTVQNVNNVSNIPPFLRNRPNSLALECNVRTLNVDLISNYSFNREQIEKTSRLHVKCNDKLFFESVLEPTQSFLRLRSVEQVELRSCKIRKIPSRVLSSLGLLRNLTISSLNGEWSNSVGMEVENGAFEGLSKLEKLDLSQNNIWAIHNAFCPLRSLAKLNLSMNRLSDLEEIFGSSFRLSNSEESSSSCVMNIQNLDISFNTLRRVSANSFNRLKKLSALRLDNNLIDELDDNSFQGLSLRLLNLSSNRLVAVPPSIFKATPNLREINLSNNSISALSPQVFNGLTTLLSLDLSRNTLTSQWITGSMFSGLNNLIILRLSHNQLSYIDATIFKDLVNLQSLHLDNNRIETVNPSAFQNLGNLRSLTLSNNLISLVDSRHFQSLRLLTHLYLDHNKIREMDDDALKNCTRLQDLGLSDNLLQEVPVALRAGLSHLVTLDIGENKITTVSNESFKGLGQVYGLRMVDNRISELPEGFCDPLTKLRVLNVAQNKIKKISASAFKGCGDMRALRVDSNLMEELPLATQLPSLLWFNVSDNKLRWADYRLLPPTIEWLDLSYNQLETLGGPVTEGKDTIPYSLRVLDASHNLLTNLDYTTIPPTLETLRVNHNLLKTVAPDTFSRSSSRLRRVELIGNQIENLPLAALKISVPYDKPVPEFYIGGNPLGCNCVNEYLLRLNQLAVLRQYPNIVDLQAISCRPTFPRSNSSSEVIPLLDAKPKDFLCEYTSHCFQLCHCCEFDACDCHMTCPDNCTCYRDSSFNINVIDCKARGHEAVPKQIPMDATELYLDGNHLPELTSHVFIGKKNLRVLHLNNSGIEVIQNKTFNGLKSLEVLRLDNNRIGELDAWTFESLHNLRELYLHNNHITHIDRAALSLPFLQVLRLDGNFLVDFSIWELSSNVYLNSVTVSNNPFSCDCQYLIPFRAFVATAKTIVADFDRATCTVGSNGTDHFYGESEGETQFITSMCDHNKELSFNFNSNSEDMPSLLDSEMLNNHISAEKVASSPVNDISTFIPSNDYNNHPNRYPAVHDIEEENVRSERSEVWTIFISVLITLVIVMLVILFVLFRKDAQSLLPVWLYSLTHCYCANKDDDAEQGTTCNILCCGSSGSGEAGKKSRARDQDADKLFDAYFVYSKTDEDLVQKIAAELESPLAYSATGTIPPPPPPHGVNSTHYRLCLHYRDLCYPLNAEMVGAACQSSKRIVVVASRQFLINEMRGFRDIINMYNSKLIFIFTEPGHSSTLTKADLNSLLNSSQITSLEWSDKNFWSKLKLLLPTPTALTSTSPSGLNSTSTISSTGSSAIFNMAPTYHPHHQNNLINYNNSLSLHEYAYNTLNSQHYHRNIFPFNANNPQIPKHLPAWQQQQLQNQNFYNNSQHSQIIPIPGYPTTVLNGSNAATPLMVQNTFQQQNIPSFNESFRRHLQQNKAAHHHQHHLSNCSATSQGHSHLHQGSHCSSHSSTSNNNPLPYKPLDANYSSSSSNEELLDHVYSTLDSPAITCEASGEHVSKQINNGSDEASSNDNSQNRLNNNASNNSAQGAAPAGTNNNGTMYFV